VKLSNRYGTNSAANEWMETGRVKQGAPFVTRKAEPGQYRSKQGVIVKTKGGGREVVTEQGSVVGTVHNHIQGLPVPE
jgi:hypothetical protein